MGAAAVFVLIYVILDALLTVAWVGKRIQITAGTAVLTVVSHFLIILYVLDRG